MGLNSVPRGYRIDINVGGKQKIWPIKMKSIKGGDI